MDFSSHIQNMYIGGLYCEISVDKHVLKSVDTNGFRTIDICVFECVPDF